MERGRSSLLIKRQLAIIGSIAAVAAVALFMTIFSFGADDSFSITEIPFFFMNGQEITVRGTFEECAPTKMLLICYPGFRSDDGNYFVLTDHDTKDLRSLIKQGHFQVTGKFSPEIPEEFAAADVAGVISVSSITPIDSV
ncbi:hypothetical protein [Candidatus Nitrososphaera gargensis]|nr:hypothetical protein [Candidatus Nitrososphaera gargensis]